MRRFDIVIRFDINVDRQTLMLGPSSGRHQRRAEPRWINLKSPALSLRAGRLDDIGRLQLIDFLPRHGAVCEMSPPS